jgi:CHAD domain-containing protein
MDHSKESAHATATIVHIPAAPEPEIDKHPRKKITQVAPGEEWHKVRKLAVRQLDRFMALEPKVLRGDDPDAIHDMRVASRRLQQVLDLIYPPPAEGVMRKLRRVIRRSRRTLSDVRNCDVLLAGVSARLGRKRASRRDIWTAVEHYLQQRRSKNFDKALGKISKMNMAGFYVNLKDHLAVNGQKPHPAPLKLLEVGAPELTAGHFYERVGKALERVAQAFENQIVQSLADPRAPVIHGARIATKRLRYLVEVIHEFGVPGSDELLVWLRDLQRHLGEWHDLEVLEEMMIEMVARPEFLREHLDVALGVEKLIQRNRVAKKELEEKYFLEARGSPEFRRMKEWIAYLLESPSAAFARA